MKTRVTIALLWVPLFAFTQSKEVSLRINFNGFHCDGKHGLCAVNMAKNETDANSIIRYDEALDVVILTINRDLLTVEDEKNILGAIPSETPSKSDWVFEVKENQILENNIKEALGIETPRLELTKGVYPVRFSKEEIIIAFNFR